MTGAVIQGIGGASGYGDVTGQRHLLADVAVVRHDGSSQGEGADRSAG